MRSIPLLALSTIATGQNVYSPGNVGTVGNVSPTGNTATTAGIFDWDLIANSTDTATRDSYAGGGSSSLNISGTGEAFRVVLGSGVDLNNAFWNANQSWANVITRSGSATLPAFTVGTVSAYNWNGSSYTLVNTASRGAFSLSGSATAGYSVNWTAIPEPSTALAGILLAAGMLRRTR